MSDKIPFSKKDSRKLTAFVGQELLYDYICNQLDPERTKALEELVAQSQATQAEVRTLKRAMRYAEQLSETGISSALLESLKAPTSYFQGFLQKVKFGDWPAGIKLGIEVLIVATMVFSAIIIVPWHRITSVRWSAPGDVTLVEIQNGFKASHSSETEISTKEISPDAGGAAKGSVTFQDEGTAAKADVAGGKADKPESDLAPAAVGQPPISVATNIVASPTPEVGAIPKPEAKLAGQILTAKTDSKTETKTEPKSEAKSEVKVEPKTETKAAVSQGYLYRGTISVTNLPVTSEKFVEKITSLGGRRAGDVELGWKKGGGAYFHFTIPEAKYDTLTSYLNEYGKLQIQKEKHERVMPDGIVRLIISVSEDKKKEK